MNELNDFFKVISEAKANDPKQKIIKEVKKAVQEDLNDIFAKLGDKPKEPVEIVEQVTEKQPEVLTEIVEVPKTPEQRQDSVDKYIAALPKDTHSYQQPVAPVVSPEMKAITDKLKFLEQWVAKISAAGPGGGEVNLRWLDDVKRDTISDGRWLKYDGSLKKFVFDEINPYEVVYNVTHVTTPTYTIQDNDYYIGVDYAGPATITLPTSANSGRVIVIKDEDGDAETNPITVLGTVDNDPGGFIIQLNNGAIQLIYRDGWRII